MKFVFFNQCELSTNTICDILKSENIPFKVKSQDNGFFSIPVYDITIDTTLEHWLLCKS